MQKTTSRLLVILAGISIAIITFAFAAAAISRRNSNQSENSNSPNDTTESQNSESTEISETRKLIFIHHSTGENWLADDNGGLGIALRDAGYYVSDTNYGWGPDGIGDRTDIGNWWEWFRGPESKTCLGALYSESGQNSEYSRLISDPGGENEIIMFKSCFPNSNLGGARDEAVPNISNNPLKSQSSDSEYHTIANAKGIYIDLLEYFKTRQNKLFIVVTAPPLGRNNTTPDAADNARSFNNWLKNEWLGEYEHDNVAVFDFYDVLTNFGDSNYAEFATDDWDDHPNSEGNQLATEGFVPWLDEMYEGWKE